MTTPTLPSGSHVVGDPTHVTDHNELAVAAAGAVYAANNGSDFADTGSTRANLHVPVLTPVAAIATANVSSLSGLNTYDGYTLAAGDLVLLTAQTTASQNGLWNAASGAWTRPTEFATSILIKGRSCRVLNGTFYAGTDWTLVAPTAGITVDTTSQTWARSEAASGTAANPITSSSASRPAGLPVVYWYCATQPTNWTSGDVWDNTVVGSPGTGITVVAKTSAYTASSGDFVLANATSAALVVTSPTAALDYTVTVKKTDSSVHTVTFTPASGTVDGAATFVIANQYDVYHFTSDGTNWWVS